MQSKIKLFFLIIIISWFIYIIFNNDNLSKSTFNYTSIDNHLIVKSKNLNNIYNNNIFLNIIQKIDAHLKSKSIPKIIRNFINEPKTLGLDMKKEFYVYQNTNSNSSNATIWNSMSTIVLPIENYDLLSKNLFNYIDFIPDNNLDIINGKHNDYDYFLFKNRFNKEDLILFAYSKESVLIYLNDLDLSFNLLNHMKNSVQKSYSLYHPKDNISRQNQLSIIINLNNIPDNYIISSDDNFSKMKKYFSNVCLDINYYSNNLKINADLQYNVYNNIKRFLYKLRNNTIFHKRTQFSIQNILEENKINFLKSDNYIFELTHKFSLYNYLIKFEKDIYFKEDLFLRDLNTIFKNLF